MVSSKLKYFLLVASWALISVILIIFSISFYQEVRISQEILLTNNNFSKQAQFNNLFNAEDGIAIDLSKNYFRSLEDIISGGFVVENEKCRIPRLDPWTSEVLPLINYYDQGPSSKCRKGSFFNLTYVSNNMLIINESVLKPEGYSLNNVSCCYKTIKRVEPNKNDSLGDKKVDNRYEYSSFCYKMQKIDTIPIFGFVKVYCKTKSPSAQLKKKLNYENFHLIPILKTDDKNSSISRKIEFWNDQKFEKNDPPPHVIIFGLDSTSRLNFHRFLKRTMKVLQEFVKPVEFKGYNKVGTNTFPNMVPFLTSYSEEELQEICYKSRWDPQDDCPYIWKEFSKNNYITALLEDAPRLTSFNYFKTGFIHPPVDMYIRPFMLAAYKDSGTRATTCLGYQRPEELIINYIVDLVTLADSKGLPTFIFSWMTDLFHEDMNNLQDVDKLLSEALLKLHQRGILQKSLLLILGDHGYRYLKIRSTFTGWFEDKLPALLVKLPVVMTEANPQYLEALEYNSEQLVTPFNMYQLFKDVLKHFGMSTDQEETTLRGLSPLTKLPSRTCREAGVPSDFCACYLPTQYKSNLGFISKAAQAMIKTINSRLPSNCKKLSVKKVFSSATFSNTRESNDYLNKEQSGDFLPEDLIISVKTIPGKFKFEAVVKYNSTTQVFRLSSHVLRLNKINPKHTSCLGKSDKAPFETYCFCK